MNLLKYLNQMAVYWSKSGIDKYGQPTWNAPVEIVCRWEYKAKQYVHPTGTSMVSTCVVLIHQDLDIGGVLMLGDLYDVNYPDSPKENTNAFEIQQFEKIPDKKAKKFVRRIYL